MCRLLVLFLVSCSCCHADSQLLCDDGYYGPNCDKECPPNCRNRRCEEASETGQAVCSDGCVDGYRGSSCSADCPRYFPACNQFNVSCFEKCERSCCTTCYESSRAEDNGDVGIACGKMIHEDFCNWSFDSHHAQIDDHGSCKCEDGYYGDKCEFRCPVCTNMYNFEEYKCKSGCIQGTCALHDEHCETTLTVVVLMCSVVFLLLLIFVPGWLICVRRRRRLVEGVDDRGLLHRTGQTNEALIKAEDEIKDTLSDVTSVSDQHANLVKTIPLQDDTTFEADMRLAETATSDSLVGITDLRAVYHDNLRLRQEVAVLQQEANKIWQNHVDLTKGLCDAEKRNYHAEVKLRLAEGMIKDHQQEITNLKHENSELSKTMQNVLIYSASKTGQHWFRQPDFLCVDLEFSSEHVNRRYCHVSREGKLIGHPHLPVHDQSFVQYHGTSATAPFVFHLQSSPPVYFEVNAEVNAKGKITMGHPYLEIGLTTEEEKDGAGWMCVAGRTSCSGVAVRNCFTHPGKVCTQVWTQGEHIQCFPDTLTHTVGKSTVLNYGVLLDFGKKKAFIVNAGNTTLLASLDVDDRGQLWPMFGVNPFSKYKVKMQFVCKDDIDMHADKKTLMQGILS